MKSIVALATLLFSLGSYAGGVETKPLLVSFKNLGNSLALDGGVETIHAYRLDSSNMPIPGNDGGGMLPVAVSSLRYLAETDSSVLLQINNSQQSFEIEDVEILKAPGLENLVRESMEQNSWISVN